MIAALLLLAGTPAAEENCGDLPQQPMNACFYQEFRRADAELNAQWKVTSAALKAADRELDRDDRQPRYFPTALAAQRAWVIYRDQHCLGQSFDARGGTLQPTLDSTCKISLTKARTAELKDLADREP
jgi:uncharacterized protein YecT (DUF1311 family)